MTYINEYSFFKPEITITARVVGYHSGMGTVLKKRSDGDYETISDLAPIHEDMKLDGVLLRNVADFIAGETLAIIMISGTVDQKGLQPADINIGKYNFGNFEIF